MHLYLGSAKVGICRLTDKQTDRQAGRQADRQAGRQTDKQADRRTSRQTDRQENVLTLTSPPQVAEGQSVTDHRFFIRTIVRHSDFVTRVRSERGGRWRGERKKGDGGRNEEMEGERGKRKEDGKEDGWIEVVGGSREMEGGREERVEVV